MRNFLLLTLSFLISTVSFCQNDNLITGVISSSFSTDLKRFKEGEKVNITRYSVDESGTYFFVVLPKSNLIFTIRSKNIENIKFEPPKTLQQVWIQNLYKNNYIETYGNNGYEYNLCHELDQAIIEYVGNIVKYDGFFIDDYLKEYLQNILTGKYVGTHFKINPTTRRNRQNEEFNKSLCYGLGRPKFI